MESKTDRIERLKHNELVFSRLPVESQKLLHEVGPKNVVWWDSNDSTWNRCVCCNVNHEVYRIKNDYKVDQTVSYKVGQENDGSLTYEWNGARHGIEMAVRNIRFQCYLYEGGHTSTSPRIPEPDGITAQVPKFVVFSNE